MQVLKFGGTSLGTPERVEVVAAIVAERARMAPIAMVVSAFARVTDTLVAAAAAAAGRDPSYRERLESLAERHRLAAEALASPDERAAVLATVDGYAEALRHLHRGVWLVQECSPRTLDTILSHGELLSAALVVAALRKADVAAEACDARSLIVTDASFGNARVQWEETGARIRAHFGSAMALQVVTGFIGCTLGGETTTLGRGGSDYTAALVGAALDAEAIEIWTDVDGVMSADPRLVPNAFSIPLLSYVELLELSHFGAKVVYPPTLHPARERAIPLIIRNTLNPAFPGTRVVETAPAPEGHPVRGIASISRLALVRLEGDWMMGLPEIVERLFRALARDGIRVLLITQGSSGHSICFAVMPVDLERARARIEEEFGLERRAGLVDEPVVETDCSVIAAVGEGMRETPGVSGRLFGVLGRHGVNVRGIAQGSSELNISVVVGERDHARALRAIHDAFFAPGARAAKVFIAGVGRVGGVLVDQIARAAAELEERRWIRVAIAGLASRRRALLVPDGIDVSRWREALAEAEADGALDALVAAAVASRDAPAVFVDCTASDAPVAHYERLLRSGVAIVSTNKRGFSGPLAGYRSLRAAASAGAGLYFGTTVGAGLPVLRTVADLVATGDRVHRIEGVLSGTLGYVLGEVMAGVALSRAVREAHERSLTEPDPREDLGGADVARKLVILAREAGFEVEPECVALEPLVEAGRWRELPLPAFWDALAGVDEEYGRRAEAARRNGRSLCHLARIEEGRCHAGIAEIGPEHPCGALRGTDNMVAIWSDRYASTPLVIRGPGAGPEVTAGGLFADLLRAVRESV
ncbi:MAG: bifunctional aspartate kinase/homoserine dehydrogenase I [Gemmatimonadetes bacterium]|nr:bifunctional aspartate kinase/homoserine dehydrogenase I [Gemmatimonadota bacterium]